MRRRIPALTATTLVLVLLACTTNNPSPPSQSPRPTHICTPSIIANPAATAPYACSSEAHRKQQERDALEAEAIALYKRFNKEVTRLEWSGGTTTMTPELDATTEYPLKGEVLEYLSDQKTSGEVLRGPEPRLSWRVVKDDQREGSLVTLATCEDMRGTTLHGPDGTEVGRGQVVVGKRYLKRFDGVLKIFFSSIDRADSCPF